MIDLRYLERTLVEQAQELQRRKLKHFCYRKEESLIDLDSPQAQVVIGVRRCGKSTLCLNALQNSNVKFAYVNFDDERLALINAEDLNSVLEVLYKIYGQFTHIFLDEVQNVFGWQLFVNRLLRNDIHIVVTGSNSKLLSSDLSTHLTGRHAVINLFPFSFEEYCDCTAPENFRDITTQSTSMRRQLFDDYLSTGGFPELMHQRTKSTYINTLVSNILHRDIVERFKIKYTSTFVRLANHIMNISPAVMNYATLSSDMGISSSQTAQNYVGYLQQAFLIHTLHKYSAKSRQRLVADKAYCIDPALMDQRPEAFSGSNLGWRLETVIYLELLRRSLRENTDIYYFNDGRRECDFILCKGNQVLHAIQVSYDISNAKTLRREIHGLLLAAEKTKCTNLTLITDHEYANITEKGYVIAIRPAHEWLLNL